MKTLIIDNYDSYTYNLFQLVSLVNDEEAIVIKNDEYTYDEIINMKFDNVIISPGPGSPENISDFGVCGEIIEKLNKPILGVCLGQQGICYFNGGEIVKADEPMHGRISKINHNDSGIFKGIKNPFLATRYHSLVCSVNLDDINIDATSEDGYVMALSHKNKPIYGVQFHPESISTEFGQKMIENFKEITKKFYEENKVLDFKIIDEEFDTLLLFKKLYKYDKKVMWLDSSLVNDNLSRFSIFGIRNGNRSHILKYDVNEKIVERIDNKGNSEKINIDIFSYLKRNKNQWEYENDIPCDFQLGYIGYLGYELKKDTISEENKHRYFLPDAYFAYIDRALIYDHKEKKLYILFYKDDIDFAKEISEILEQDYLDENLDIYDNNIELKLAKNKDEYINDIRKIKDLIVQGESYEVCLTNRLDIRAKLNPNKYYEILRKLSPGPYSCLINFDEVSIACSSMERFLRINKDRIVETKPIKGTVRRGIDKDEDKKLIEELKTEEKTFSENLMIVDLLRNDLGKVCEVGSINVPKLMDVESYSTLHQLISTVTGKINNKFDTIDVIKACFPGGSMTGAPKKRTLEIIDELENYPRGIYSGAIGYISNNECIDFNIVIRTTIIEKERATLGVGGAIIYLSDEEDEFSEILLKAKASLRALSEYYNREIKIIE